MRQLPPTIPSVAIPSRNEYASLTKAFKEGMTSTQIKWWLGNKNEGSILAGMQKVGVFLYTQKIALPGNPDVILDIGWLSDWLMQYKIS